LPEQLRPAAHRLAVLDSTLLRVLRILNGMGEKQGQAEDEWIRMVALFEGV
jgi:hypothetical protein